MGTLVLSPSAMPDPPSLMPLDGPGPAPPDFFSFGSGPLPPTPPFNFAVPQPGGRTSPAFTFELVTHPSDAAPNPLKRRRRLTDVDGDGTAVLLRKKRRLLKTLITSRLSRPYSCPATNIADRGTNKAALWARIRRTRSGTVAANLKIGVDRNAAGPDPILRKAAILNRLRLLGARSNSARELVFSAAAVAAAAPLRDQLRSQEPGEATRATDEPFVETTEERIESPNMAAGSLPYTPLAPSPLGFSNYDALDLEDEWPDDDGDDDNDDDGGGGGGSGGDGDAADEGPYRDLGEARRRRDSIYSDFSVFDFDAADDYDDDDACNTLGFSAMPL